MEPTTTDDAKLETPRRRVELLGDRSRLAEDGEDGATLVRDRADGIERAWVIGAHSAEACITGTVVDEELPVWPERRAGRLAIVLDNGSRITTDAELVRGIEEDPEATALGLTRYRLARGISGGAVAPAFASAPRIGAAQVDTANTNRDGTGTIVDVLTGVAAGTLIPRVRLQSTGNPADSIVTLFLYNGSSYFLWDEVDLGDPAAGSTTVAAYGFERAYNDLILPGSSWKLAAAITVALTSGKVNVFALGGDLT